MPINPSINSPLAQGASQQTFGDWSGFRQFGSAVRQGANVAGNYAIQQQRAKEQKDYTLRSAYATRDFNTVYNEAKISGEPVSPEWLEQKVDEYLETNEKLRSHFDTYPDHRDTIRESLLSRFSDDAFQFQHQQDVARQEMEYQEEVHGLLEPFRQKPSITPEDWNLLKTDALALRDMATLSPQAKEAHARQWDQELLTLASRSLDEDTLNDILAQTRTLTPGARESVRERALQHMQKVRSEAIINMGQQLGREFLFGNELEDDPELLKAYTYEELLSRLDEFQRLYELEPDKDEGHDKIVKYLQSLVDERKNWTPAQFVMANNPQLAQEWEEAPWFYVEDTAVILQKLQDNGKLLDAKIAESHVISKEKGTDSPEYKKVQEEIEAIRRRGAISPSVDIMMNILPPEIAERELATLERLLEFPDQFIRRLDELKFAFGENWPYVVDTLQRTAENKSNPALSWAVYFRESTPNMHQIVKASRSDKEVLAQKVQMVTGKSVDNLRLRLLNEYSFTQYYNSRTARNGGEATAAMRAEWELLPYIAAQYMLEGASEGEAIRKTVSLVVDDHVRFLNTDWGTLEISKEVVKDVDIFPDFLEYMGGIFAGGAEDTRWAQDNTFLNDWALERMVNNFTRGFTGVEPAPRTWYGKTLEGVSDTFGSVKDRARAIVPTSWFGNAVSSYLSTATNNLLGLNLDVATADFGDFNWRGPSVKKLGLRIPDHYGFPPGMSRRAVKDATNRLLREGRWVLAPTQPDPNDIMMYFVIPGKVYNPDRDIWENPRGDGVHPQGIPDQPLVDKDGKPYAVSFREMMEAHRQGPLDVLERSEYEQSRVLGWDTARRLPSGMSREEVRSYKEERKKRLVKIAEEQSTNILFGPIQ